MDSQIIKRFNDAILHEAMRRYGIAENQIKPLDGFESFIYEFERDGDGYILRIGHSFRKSEALIQGEVDWINYLARGGVSVAQAIPSLNGKLVEAIDDAEGGQFFGTAFVKAEGQAPWNQGWSPARYESYGEMLGKIHALSIAYEPPVAAWRRTEWDDPTMKYVDLYLPQTEVIAHREYQSLLKHIYSLPKDKSSYGLIHQDAHQSNFFMDANGKLTLFDFDDCAYSWFINDIAIVLFYISMDAKEFGYPSVNAFTQEFMTHFLKGYRTAYLLDDSWLKEIPHFLKLRELELYAVIFRDFDINNINNPWVANFMKDRKMRIDQRLPFIEFDWESMRPTPTVTP